MILSFNCHFGSFLELSTSVLAIFGLRYQISDICHLQDPICHQRPQIQNGFFLKTSSSFHLKNKWCNLCKFFWKLRPFAVVFDIWHLEDPICHQSSYMSQMQKGLFWIQVASSTLKLNDLIWAKNAKSWIPSSSSWGPINVAHLKNFGILDRHALQFLNVYSSVHPSIFKSYVSQVYVLQKFKWIWKLFLLGRFGRHGITKKDKASTLLLLLRVSSNWFQWTPWKKTAILLKYPTFEGVSLILLWAKQIKSYIFCIS